MSEPQDGTTPTLSPNERPVGNLDGFKKYFVKDFLSGFLVFLIALPLCLGIAFACGYPTIAGIFTAIIGAIIAPMISNSELTIKGPAAGLIVIAIGTVEAFGGDGAVGGFTATDMKAYQMALAVGVVAALLQVGLALFRAGFIAEFFPLSAVHGMLAAIGVIIIVKQFPVALGVQGAKGAPMEMIANTFDYLGRANPLIAIIGLTGVLIMFGWPMLQKKYASLKPIPGPIIVLFVTVLIGLGERLTVEHSYALLGHQYHLGESYLVNMPKNPFGMFDKLTTPDFSALKQPVAWKWIFMFFIIGSLESLLSAKAVDLLDPWKRKTNLNRDLLAVGAGNFVCAMVGGLPMISEIVRSRANIDNGARTRFANMWHGIILLLCVAMIPMIIHLIPYAALASMLIYTGFRLCHPTEFVHAYKVGREQLVIFLVTLIGVLATDLLIGIVLGILTKLIIHIANGAPMRSLFRLDLEITERKVEVRILVHQSLVFSNWIPFRKHIDHLGLLQNRKVVLDLSETRLVDHTVMQKLSEMQDDFKQVGVELHLIGLETHQSLAPHQHAARRRGLATVRRLTVVADPSLEKDLTQTIIRLGATGYTSFPCQGAGRQQILEEDGQAEPRVRIEVIVPWDICEDILNYLRHEILLSHRIMACVETVDVIRLDSFLPSPSEPEANGKPREESEEEQKTDASPES